MQPAANRPRQGIIRREKLAFQLLGQRDVCGIVGREIRAELEHPSKQRLMSVTNEWEIQIILQGLRRAHGGESPRQQTPSQSRCHLDVTKLRGVKVDVGRLQDAFNFDSAIRAQEVFDEYRGIDDDDPQEAFLVARSLLISAAADSARSTGVRRAIRAKSSWGRGRVTSRSKICWTY